MGRTIAVTGVSGYLGSRVAATLAADSDVDCIVGIDVAPPPGEGFLDELEFHEIDIRDPDLGKFITGADTIVHLAFVLDPMRDETEMADVNLGGMRNVLDAAEDAGVLNVVYTSSASAYGAHPDNAVPLHESDRLRANADFSYGAHKMESEHILRDWVPDHPDVVVTVLRPAIVLGAHVSNFISRTLEAPRLLSLRGHSPPFQAVHEDDAVSAVSHVTLERIPGTFNVAADDVATLDDLAELVGRGRLEVDAGVARRIAAAAWRLGQAEAPPGVVDYFMYPWVVSNEALRSTGWTPRHTTREALAEMVAANSDFVTLGRARRTRAEWRRIGAVTAAAGTAATALAAAALRLRR